MPSFHARLICACILALAASACTRVPELDDQRSETLKSSAYPALLPLDRLVAPLPDPQADSATLEQELTARSSRLQTRANALNTAPQ